MEAPSEPLDGDQNKGPVYCAVALSFCALACVFVLLRMFVRIKMIHSIGWDDVFICLALVSIELLEEHSDVNPEAALGTVSHNCSLQCHE